MSLSVDKVSECVYVLPHSLANNSCVIVKVHSPPLTRTLNSTGDEFTWLKSMSVELTCVSTLFTVLLTMNVASTFGVSGHEGTNVTYSANVFV